MAEDATLDSRRICSSAAIGSKKKNKTTLGWVVNGRRRHAGQQEDLLLRGLP
jgi:hypothetical protein